MHIAYIVSDDNIVTTDYIKVVKPEEYVDDGKYTLVVGKINVKKVFPFYNPKYTDRKIDDRHFWTFSKFEKRNIYESDVKEFVEHVLKNIVSGIQYSPINILCFRYADAIAFMHAMNDEYYKTVYVGDDAFYIYKDKHIYGISFDEMGYIGIGKERLLNFFKRCRNTHMVFNSSFVRYNRGGFKYCETKYIPYLYFLNKT